MSSTLSFVIYKGPFLLQGRFIFVFFLESKQSVSFWYVIFHNYIINSIHSFRNILTEKIKVMKMLEENSYVCLYNRGWGGVFFFFERLSQHGAKRQNSQLKCSCVATKSKLKTNFWMKAHNRVKRKTGNWNYIFAWQLNVNLLNVWCIFRKK